MTTVDTGTVVCRALREQGVKHVFGLYGGHVIPIVRRLEEHGIQLVHVRHEQTAAYAADACARVTGRPGVCLVTAGCGLTNAVTGLAVAASARSSVVCVSGQHPTYEDGMGAFQEAYGSDIVGSFAKYTKRVLEWSTVGFDLHQAFRAAFLPPQGVALLEIPINIMQRKGEENDQKRRGKTLDLHALRSAGNPRTVEKALELLHKAKKPLIVAGDGLFWSGGQAELRKMAETTNTPVYGRRAGRGALDEAHPLSFRGPWSRPFTGDADFVMTFGFRFWSGENFGRPPKWADRATYVRIDDTADQVWSNGPADMAIVGDPKTVLRQMIDKVREMGLDFSSREDSAWIQRIRRARQTFEVSLLERARKNASARPIHPDRIMREMLSVIDADATLIKDSFTLSGYVDQWFTPHTTGQVVDAGPLAPVGAGVGMALGAQLGRPGKQVIVVSGDGGIGIGGMDLETAVRYRIPIVVVVFNNSSWGPDPAITFEMEELRADFEMLPNIRYDKVFEPLGVHVEHVEDPEALMPAFQCALESGKPALIHIVSGNRYGNPALGIDFFSQDRF